MYRRQNECTVYEFNGTDSQKWFLRNNNDGIYTFYIRLGADTHYRDALDIADSSNENCVNVQIYTSNGTNAQRFKLQETTYHSWVRYTEVSNFNKAIVFNGLEYYNGRNVDQYTFQGHLNEAWLLEPVDYFFKMRVSYASYNALTYCQVFHQ